MVEDILKLDFNIIGVVTSKIQEKEIRNFDIDKKILKLCLLDNDLKELSSKDNSKMKLAQSINNDVIVLSDFSKGLNYKELNYFYRLFNKLVTKKHKKIILISRDIEFLFQICDTIAIYQNRVIYHTKDFYEDKLYNYIDMPKIVKFIKLSNQKGAKLTFAKDLNELIKDIYRRSNESKNSD